MLTGDGIFAVCIGFWKWIACTQCVDDRAPTAQEKRIECKRVGLILI